MHTLYTEKRVEHVNVILQRFLVGTKHKKHLSPVSLPASTTEVRQPLKIQIQGECQEYTRKVFRRQATSHRYS